jgi:aspartyl-tRNA(Asn)/glutamyl-tRNA(Gln) amidotransferase subunit B
LPEQRIRTYIEKYALPEYDARVISDERETAEYFEQLIQYTTNYKAAANWMIGPVKSYLNDQKISIKEFSITPKSIAQTISLVDDGKVNFSVASTKIFNALLQDPSAEPLQIATSMNLFQDADTDTVAAWVDQVLNNMPEKVNEYKKGKKGLIGLFVGEVKKVSKGKADPKLTNELLLKKLQS